MDLLPIANFLVSSLSALSSMVQAYNSSKITNEDIKKARKKLDEPLKIGGSKVSQVIDSELLQTLSSKAEQEARELIKLLTETQDIELLEQPMTEANSRLCFYLSQIKSHNNGDLPTKRLKQLWLSHRCEEKDVCNG